MYDGRRQATSRAVLMRAMLKAHGTGRVEVTHRRELRASKANTARRSGRTLVSWVWTIVHEFGHGSWPRGGSRLLSVQILAGGFAWGERV
jgi:hypothetical protein